MTLALSGKELERKTVADYHDALYQGVMIDKARKETAGLPGSFDEKLEAELRTIAAEKGLSQYQTAQIGKMLHDMDIAEQKQFLDELKAIEVYTNPETGESVPVMPGEAPPPGYTKRASTSSTTISPYDRTMQTEKAKDLSSMTSSMFSNNVLEDLLKNREDFKMLQLTLTPPDKTDAVYQNKPGEYEKDLKKYQDDVTKYITMQVDEARDRARKQFLTFKELQNGWDVAYTAGGEVEGEYYPEGLYKANNKTGEFEWLMGYSPVKP